MYIIFLALQVHYGSIEKYKLSMVGLLVIILSFTIGLMGWLGVAGAGFIVAGLGGLIQTAVGVYHSLSTNYIFTYTLPYH